MSQKIHLALKVSHIGKSIAFYTALFGTPPTKRKGGYAKFDLHNPRVNFTLNHSSQAGQGPVSHFGIQVVKRDQVFTEKARLEALGLETLVEEEKECCCALQDKVWVRDPDGNAWEIFFVIRDVEELRDHVSTCCA